MQDASFEVLIFLIRAKVDCLALAIEVPLTIVATEQLPVRSTEPMALWTLEQLVVTLQQNEHLSW